MIKLSQIVESHQALKTLLEIKLPVNVAYKIIKLVNKIQPELVIYEEQRNKLIKELGEQTDVATNQWTVKPENLPKFQEEMVKLLDIEINLEFAPGHPLEKLNVLSLGEEAKISSNDLVLLSWLFE